jgi:hypothetical protein
MQSSERRGRGVWHLRVSTPVLRELGGTPLNDLGMYMYDGTKVFDDSMNDTGKRILRSDLPITDGGTYQTHSIWSATRRALPPDGCHEVRCIAQQYSRSHGDLITVDILA